MRIYKLIKTKYSIILGITLFMLFSFSLCYISNIEATSNIQNKSYIYEDQNDKILDVKSNAISSYNENDFKVIRGTTVFRAKSTQVTITEGIHYTLEQGQDASTCFIRITNTRFSSMGKIMGGGGENHDTWGARILNPKNIENSITFTKDAALDATCRITWEIIQYVGHYKNDNSMIIRDAGIATCSGTTNYCEGESISTIINPNKVCVFITGQYAVSASRKDIQYALFTAELIGTGTYTPRFTRGQYIESNDGVSYAIVEFIGSNWAKVQRLEILTECANPWIPNDYTSAYIDINIEDEGGKALNDYSKAFLHLQYMTNNDACGVNDAGDTVELINNTSLRIRNSATDGIRSKMVWIIENLQTTGNVMKVEHGMLFDGTTDGSGNERTWIHEIIEVDNFETTSIFCRATVDGGGTAFPRGAIDYRLSSRTQIKFTESDEGQERIITYDVVQWPTAPRPQYSNLLESADPLELSETEKISINALDNSGIKQVFIQIEEYYFNMTHISGDTWQYDSWKPESTGIYIYTISIQNNIDDWNYLIDSIEVIDSIAPTIYEISQSADPLELGDIEIISIKTYDISGIKRVFINHNGNSILMKNIEEDIWQGEISSFLRTGIIPYSITVEDNFDNSIIAKGEIEIVDTTGPSYSGLKESTDPLELGNTEIIHIDVHDLSGIESVTINMMDGIWHEMINLEGNTWQYDKWTPTKLGTHNYYIQMEDNILNSVSILNEIEVIDTTIPSYSNLLVTPNPLELGDNTNISISVSDIAGINQVLIEFENNNNSMINLEGDDWYYDEWTPTEIGNFSFIINMQDLSGNWNQVQGILEVIDTTAPTHSNLLVEPNPLELGEYLSISLDIYDPSGIDIPYLYHDSAWHLMTFVADNSWKYDAWTPNATGTVGYYIYSRDKLGNYEYFSANFQVVDTTLPDYSNLIESSDPLELGDTEVITINATDYGGIYQVFIEFNNVNHSMTKINKQQWQYDSWVPSNTDNHTYTISIQDNNHNWNSITRFIEVIDTTSPIINDIIESADPLELGNNEIITVNTSDLSGVWRVLLIFNQSYQWMTNIEGDIWQSDIITPQSVGTHSYTIYIEDYHENKLMVNDEIQVVDTTLPTVISISESDNPLELGDTEILNIEAIDIAGIKNIYINLEQTWYQMIHIGGNEWRYDSLVPEYVGNYEYSIKIIDNNNNERIIQRTIAVIDTTLPEASELVESADPSELGDIIIISIDVTDLSGISKAQILLDGTLHLMQNVNGNTWQYDSWIPVKTGNYSYSLHFEDNNENSLTILDKIQVIDTTNPSFAELTESADPLELGNNETINIDAFDISGIKCVYINIGDDRWYFMSNIYGNTWQYDIWTPQNTGSHAYTIYIEDNNGNYQFIHDSIDIVDTTPPKYFNIVKNEDTLILGDNLSITVQLEDHSGINQVIIDFNGTEYNMNKINENTWQFQYFELDTLGILNFTISVSDNENNWNYISDFIIVLIKDTSGADNFDDSTDFNLLSNPITWIALISTSSIVGIIMIQRISKTSQKKIKEIKINGEKIKDNSKNVDPETRALLQERARITNEAKNATDAGDYTKAAEIYKRCKRISIKLYRDGLKHEKINRDTFARLETEAISIDSKLAITTHCINDLLTEFGNDIGCWYYSEPQIYYQSQNMTDGLILNDNNFLYNRLTNNIDGNELTSESKLNPEYIAQFKAVQFLFTNNISVENVLDLAINYQANDTFLFIIGLKWPNDQYNQLMEFPPDDRIKYQENIRVLSQELFADIIGLKGNYRKRFNKIIQLNRNMEVISLKKIHDSSKIILHDTNDLIDDLKKNGIIEEDINEFYR